MIRRVAACGFLVSVYACTGGVLLGEGGKDSGGPVLADGGGGDSTVGDSGRDATQADGGSDSGQAGTDAAPADAASQDAAPCTANRSAECCAQDQALQPIVDGDRLWAPNSALAVRNLACGASVYVSGSPSTATTTSLWQTGVFAWTFVSASILSLVQQGVVSLDDPLSKWVPNVPNTTGVTVEMLLDKRSGIYDYFNDPSFDCTKPWTPAQIVAFATQHPPYFAPDQGWHDGLTDYVLLGMILEAATGQKAGAVLHQRAIDPAGLSSTFLWGYDSFDPNRMARGFVLENGVPVDVTLKCDPSALWTAGAWISSATDLVDWVTTLYGTDTILDPSQRALLTSKTTDMSLYGAPSGWRFGLGITAFDSSFTGSAGPGLGICSVMGGFVTCAHYFPDLQTSVGWIRNLQGPGNVWDNVARVASYQLQVVKTLFPDGPADAGTDAAGDSPSDGAMADGAVDASVDAASADAPGD